MRGVGVTPGVALGVWRWTAGGCEAGYCAAGRWGTSPVPTSMAGVRAGRLGRPEEGVKLGGGSFLFGLVASLFGDKGVPIS